MNLSSILAVHGLTAVLLICAFLLVEETGVPVPLLSGDVLLVLAGVLIIKGNMSAWEFFPAAIVAELAGVMTAHFWSRTLGQRGLRAAANKLRMQSAVDRASARLGAARPIHIAVARLVPGLRVTTSLVAGASGVGATTFFVGVAPAIVIWLAAYTFLGVLVGVPVIAALGHVQGVALSVVILVLIGIATLAGIRYIPSTKPTAPPWIGSTVPVLVTLSVMVDVTIAMGLASGMAEMLRAWLGFDALIPLAIAVSDVVLVYIGLTRLMIGGTAGERLTGVRYGVT